MADIGTCPYCNKDFDAQKVGYGRNRDCPNCGEAIDVWPEAEIFAETPWGHVELGFNGHNGVPHAIRLLAKLFRG